MSADAKVFGACFLILLPFYWAPLLVTEILPGLDLPFHLAIADMLGKRGSLISPYAAFYEGSFRVAPYAAHYLMLVAFGKVMSLLAAHKLIVALYIAAMPLSTAALLAACGRSRVPALLAFPLAYNLTLHYGFVSFALSLPVLLFLLAQVVRHLCSSSAQVWRSWRWTAAMALFLFLCHLQNFFCAQSTPGRQPLWALFRQGGDLGPEWNLDRVPQEAWRCHPSACAAPAGQARAKALIFPLFVGCEFPRSGTSMSTYAPSA